MSNKKSNKKRVIIGISFYLAALFFFFSAHSIIKQKNYIESYSPSNTALIDVYKSKANINNILGVVFLIGGTLVFFIKKKEK